MGAMDLAAGVLRDAAAAAGNLAAAATMIDPNADEGATPGDATAHSTRFVVVGIGADGWAGLSDAARTELRSATVVYGSERQLALLRDDGASGPAVTAELRPWRSPMSAHLADVLSAASDGADVAADGGDVNLVHILASGDPMFHGVGSSIVAAVGRHQVRVIPAPSSASLAAARLGWDLAGVRIVSTVHADPTGIVPDLAAGRRLLILSRNEATPAAVADILTRHGFGRSPLIVLEQLGGPAERITEAPACRWADTRVRANIDPDSGVASAGIGEGASELPVPDPLNIIAVDCVGPAGGRGPGLPDSTYEHDGQLTKSAIRALTVAALNPGGNQVLWDIGAGSGSVAIEWLRADRGGRAIAFERDPERAKRIDRNAQGHGVSDALEIRGAVPDALAAAAVPDAVFIGGGLDAHIADVAWEALRAGGRLVVNAVTVETQSLLTARHATFGGTLRRIALETAEPLGSLTTWRPALPIVQWVADKSGDTP
ncbi:bifunctional cobalt-precorrin-7 (C(5))-methyltransferase/cobalt-precorrin-6B (C(15))-methyltransferase [Gordonia sinesedis]